jgi:hypothetical protein
VYWLVTGIPPLVLGLGIGLDLRVSVF